MDERDELHLEVVAARSGRGPATWGQQAIWDAVSVLGDDAPRYNVSVGFQLPAARPLAAVLEALTHAAQLHESLRTRLQPDEAGGLAQILDATGGIPVTVRRCAREETERVGGELLAELAASPFDCAVRWPIRVGLVEADGLVRHYGMALSHTAADGGGLRRLARDMVMLLEGVSPRRLREMFPATQPLDQAAYQCSERGRKRDAASRKYWRTKLSEGPRALFPVRGGRTPDALFPNAVLRSPALLRAVDHVAAVHGVSGSSVVLAAAARQVSRLSRAPEPLLQVVVNNRFLPGMSQTITTLAQEGLFHLRTADEDFGALVRRVHAGALGAYRYASYDKRLLDRDIAELRGRLPDLADHSCFLNDTREPELFRPSAEDTEPPPLASARELTTLDWPVEFPPRKNLSFAMDVVDVPGAVELAMTADSALIPRSDMASFLRGIEDAVVEDALATGCV
ncbi:condensation domain-containing protein [Actinacidiphila sp. ITFR-21]|uniref:condensation domain-containing protein n=1 Tax=Actinacidiphila sp. ITFR-21 TaxID=3075199 RepID=UPI0028891A7C|nr:condensation domain-containing protein [Streptomyces sp. ITFR-21]WNI19427.1 condensation domain-containing protein [Streptomyces sp. ITFR-21]